MGILKSGREIETLVAGAAMKIWVDAQCLQSPSFMRGIGRYVLEFLQALADDIGPENLIASLNSQLLDEAIAARDTLLTFLPNENIQTWQGIADSSLTENRASNLRKLSQIALANHVMQIAPDVALCASPFEGMSDTLVPFLPPPKFPVKSAAIFYDAIPHRLPDQYLPISEMAEAYQITLSGLKTYQLLLCISDYVRREANEIHPNVGAVNIGAGVSSVYDGYIGERNNAIRPNKETFSILYVGGLDPRKNLRTLIAAISLLHEHGRETIELQIVGDYPEPARQALEQTWRDSCLPESSLKMLGYIPDESLIQKFRAANVVVQPSLLEGFGLTALEALRCGGRVLASSGGALPEVVENTNLLFDPNDIESMAERIAWAIDEPEAFNRAVNDAAEKAKRYSWPNTSKLALEGLKSIPQPKSGRKNFNAERAAREMLVDDEEIDLLLSASLPIKQMDSHLQIDITSTARTDHKTGIQRVVRKVYERGDRLRSDHWSKHSFIGSNQPEGFFKTALDCPKTPGSTWDALSHQIEPTGRAETILMLDSSWEFHRQHLQTLKQARLNGTQVISVMYDLVPLRLSAFCDAGMPVVFSAWLKSALQYSTGFVCISKTIADELIELLEAIEFPRAMKIGYWHLGADFQTSIRAHKRSLKKQTINATKRFLSVGTLEPRKGQAVILSAFEHLWNRGSQDTLTLVGKEGWGVGPLVEKIRTHPEFGKKLRWLHQADDAELAAQYENCDALIAASYGEGFGLPIIEAQQRGISVLASDIPVFREVSGSGQNVSFFKTGSPESLAKTISKFSRSDDAEPSYRNVLDWDGSVDALHAVISNKNWYKTYPGKSGTKSTNGNDIGILETNSPVFEGRTNKKAVEIVGEKSMHRLSVNEQVFVRITNFTSKAWTSAGSHPINLIVFRTKEDKKIVFKYISFALVVPPGDEQYFGLGTLRELSDLDADAVEVCVWQEGFGRLGATCKIELKQAARNQQ